MALRDTGWIILFAKDNQEVLDSVVQAFKIAEDREVMLPAIVNMEGYVLSYTRQPLTLLEQKDVDKFLPSYKPKVVLDVEKPMSLGVPVMKEYGYFKSQTHKAQLNALEVIKKVCHEFKKDFGRCYELVEKYKTEDAHIIFVACGSISTTIQESIDTLRKQGLKVGLLRIRSFRPFPSLEIRKALESCDRIIVIDSNVAPGSGGIIYPEICSLVNNEKVYDVIIGLGGRPVGKRDFETIARKIVGKIPKKLWVI